MAATTRERLRLDRRADILAQAALIVGERGYHGFGLQELADRCGLTKAGVLHHFHSKEELLVAVLRDRDRDDEAVVAEFAGVDSATAPSDRATMLAIFRAIVARNATRPELVRLYAMLRGEALSPNHPAHDFFRAREAATIDMFAQIVAPHASAPRSKARLAAALMSGLELQWLREDMGFDLVAEWDRGAADLFA